MVGPEVIDNCLEGLSLEAIAFQDAYCFFDLAVLEFDNFSLLAPSLGLVVLRISPPCEVAAQPFAIVPAAISAKPAITTT